MLRILDKPVKAAEVRVESFLERCIGKVFNVLVFALPEKSRHGLENRAENAESTKQTVSDGLFSRSTLETYPWSTIPSPRGSAKVWVVLFARYSFGATSSIMFMDAR